MSIFDSQSMKEKDMIKVCANCKGDFIEGDRYCRFCGAPMGKPEYIEDSFAAIYGPPPVRRRHSCINCGYSWITDKMIDREKHCPMCGGSAPISPCPISVQLKDSDGKQYTTFSDDGVFVIGRDSYASTFVIPDSTKTISRKHAKLVWNGQEMSITDLDSLNGTFVNNSPRITSKVIIRQNDIITLGNKSFIIIWSAP